MITSAITSVELFWSHSMGLGICSSPKSWETNGVFVESLELRQKVFPVFETGSGLGLGWEGHDHKHRVPEQNLTSNQWFNTNVGKVSRINITLHCLMLYISLTGHLNSNSFFSQLKRTYSLIPSFKYKVLPTPACFKYSSF